MSHSPPQQLCTANPDIAGLGIRISVYIHAFLIPAILSLCVFLHRSNGFFIDPRSSLLLAIRTLIVRLQMHLQFLGCALLLAALIRATTVGLSVYHMLIVLNLSWLNVIAVIFTPLVFPLVNPDVHRNLLHLFSIIATIVQGILGLWMWSTIRTFGAKSGCVASAVTTSLFGRKIQATNSVLFIASIVIYSCLVLSAFASGYFWSLVYRFMRNPYKRPKPRFISYPASLIYLAGFSAAAVVFIIDTELIVRRNRRLFDSEEFHWTLGQVLAMLLLIPLMNVATVSSETPRSDPPIDPDGNPIPTEFSSTIPPS